MLGMHKTRIYRIRKTRRNSIPGNFLGIELRFFFRIRGAWRANIYVGIDVKIDVNIDVNICVKIHFVTIWLGFCVLRKPSQKIFTTPENRAANFRAARWMDRIRPANFDVARSRPQAPTFFPFCGASVLASLPRPFLDGVAFLAIAGASVWRTNMAPRTRITKRRALALAPKL